MFNRAAFARSPLYATVALLTVLAGLALATPLIAQGTTMCDGTEPMPKVDADCDGLIEIDSLSDLNNMRYNLAGTSSKTASTGEETEGNTNGCPMVDPDGEGGEEASPTCHGYELTRDLDFDPESDGHKMGDPYWNGGKGWDPIGEFRNRFVASFEGNQYTIANLFINRGSENYIGLFNSIDYTEASKSAVEIKNLGLIGVNVRGGFATGGLAGLIDNNVSSVLVRGVYVTGTVSSSGFGVGGLIGGSQGIRTVASYAAVTVEAKEGQQVGGLIGSSAEDGSIKASFAVAAVLGAGVVGGLTGNVGGGSSEVFVEAAYAVATISVDPDNAPGGLNGHNLFPNPGIKVSYIDATISGVTHPTQSKTTAQLQTPTGYRGIYANWNVDLNDDKIPDDPWHFGNNMQYPGLSLPQRGQNADKGCRTYKNAAIAVTVELVGERCIHRPKTLVSVREFDLVAADDTGFFGMDRVTNKPAPRLTGVTVPNGQIRIVSTATDAMEVTATANNADGVFTRSVMLNEGDNGFAVYVTRPDETEEYGAFSTITVTLDTMGPDAAAINKYLTPNEDTTAAGNDHIVLDGIALQRAAISTVGFTLDVPSDADYSDRRRLYFATKQFSIQYISSNTNTVEDDALYERLSFVGADGANRADCYTGDLATGADRAFAAVPECDLSDLADGAYSVRVEVGDIAGNGSSLSSARTFVLDTAPPNLGVFKDTTDDRIHAEVADANLHSIEYQRLDGSAADACDKAFRPSSPTAYNPDLARAESRLEALPEGSVYCFVATDLAGNRAVFSSAHAEAFTGALRLKLRLFLESALP